MRRSRMGLAGYRTCLSALLRMMLVALILAACGGSDSKDSGEKVYKVGVLCQSQALAAAFDGFKEGMAELGYVEGKNITYLYDGPTGTVDALEPALDKLVSQKIDLLLSIGTPPTTLAKQKLEGKNIPVVFAPLNDPVGEGIVDSLTHPGGFLTGIINGDTIGKSLEWLLEVLPNTRRIFVPHNPTDLSSARSVEVLQAAADPLGIELVIGEASTPEEISALAGNLPDNIDAIFMVRSGSINAKVLEFVQAGNQRGIPVFASVTGELVESGALLGFGSSFFSLGKQVARLADQILRGASPATLPVQVSEAFLAVNMKTAAALGVEISDTVLRQATEVIRD